MKELFYNSVGKNTCKVTCENNKGTFELFFHLSNNPVQYIWQSIHANNVNIKTAIHQGVSFDTLFDRLKDCCLQVGINDIELPLTTTKLNWLHNQYVLSEKTELWHEINHIIHTLESKLNNNPFDKFDSSVLFFAENEKRIPIKDEYKIFLNTDVVWGKLELGYGTLGKDWMDVAHDGDELSDLAIQSEISSEAKLMFCPEQVKLNYQEEKFYKWVKKTEYTVPTNLHELSLGKYVLGQIIITDVFLSYHNIASDWYVPNHKCKLLWNKEFFTPDTKVKKVDFMNSDLFFNTLVSHTGFGDLNV